MQISHDQVGEQRGEGDAAVSERDVHILPDRADDGESVGRARARGLVDPHASVDRHGPAERRGDLCAQRRPHGLDRWLEPGALQSILDREALRGHAAMIVRAYLQAAR